MKTSVFYGALAFLAGMALFGFLTSLALTKKNADLTRQATALKRELIQAQEGWEVSKRHLSESRIKTAELESEVVSLTTRLSRSEKEAKEYLDHVALLSDRLRDTAQANAALAESQAKVSERFLRLELENSELRRRFASVAELKRAIQALKVKEPSVSVTEIRPHKTSGRAEAALGLAGKDGASSGKDVSVHSFQQQVSPPAVTSRPLVAAGTSTPARKRTPAVIAPAGNKGFFVKDGRSTFHGIVDIQVLPIDRGAT